MIFNKASNKNDTFSPKITTPLKIKLVTSYTLFLVVILCLTGYLYITTQKTFFLTLGIVFLLVGVLLIVYFTHRLLTMLTEMEQNLYDIAESKSQLLQVVDHQKPLLRHTYIQRLLTGSLNGEEEAGYILHYMELDSTPSPCFNVMYTVIYHNLSDTMPGASEQLFNETTRNSIIQDAILKFFGPKAYYYTPSGRTYALLLSFPQAEEKDFLLKTQDTVRELHEYLLQEHGIWLYAGIGKNTSNPLNIWESYQQAMEAVNYTTKNYIYLPYEMIKKDSNVFYYPPELSTKMIHFITKGNKTQVIELFNLVHQENIEERSLPLNLIKFLLSDIRNTLLKARFALPETIDAETIRLLDERFNEPLTFQLCEGLALSLCALFDTKEENETLSTTIEKYIIENFKDPSLCLNKISDEFQISESYFSHMFKDKTGVNFSTYLENLRMAEALRLIKETDISLNELYIAVGYNNQNSFRRAFKKIYGVTPSSMR